MVDATQNTDSAAALFASMNAKSAPKTSKASETQDRFLKLLVTQMKNQDPLNPMDNAQVTSQMAQLSTVTGIDKLNVTLQALSDSMMGSQSLQAASMIGHGVLVDGKDVDLSDGAGYGGFQLDKSVKNAQISIYDKAGVLVRSIELGEQPAGIARWAWDGKSNSGADMSDGRYTFDVSINYGDGGKNASAPTLQFGMVSSVTQGKQGVTLGIGQMEGIELSQVRQIL